MHFLTRTAPQRHSTRFVVNPTLIALLVLGFPLATSATNVSKLEPPTLSDGLGNTADENSLISYRNVNEKPGRSAQCSECIGDDGIRPFLNAAENFAHFVLPDYPYDLIEKVADQRTSEITDDYEKLIKDNIGLVICIGIGILFIVIFPIVGCCFCCCRCCGKCGGSRKTDGRPEKGCKRHCFTITLLVLSLMVCAGGAMMIFTSDSISNGLKAIHDDVPANLDALTDHLNDSTEVIDEIATTDLNFTRDVIFRDLDNIGYIFGGMVRDNFLNETNEYIDVISKSTIRMDADLARLKDQIPEVNEQLSFVKANVSAYASAMVGIRNYFDTNMSATVAPETAPDISTTVDGTKLDSFTGTSEIDNVGNLTEKLDNSLKEINDIPEQVQNKSTQSVKDLKSSIMDYTSSVTDTTDDLDFADRIDLDDAKDKIVDYADRAMEYDDYRKDAGAGLGALVIVIAMLLLLGIIFGVCGSKSSTPPEERGCVSNSGGNLLIAAVIVTFIFGSILMLLTTILFLVGSPVESYGCVAFRDTSIIDKLLDDYKILGSVSGSGTFLGDKILDDPNKNMTLSEILSSCKKNEGIYKAMRINESDFFNITEILDYRSEFSVKDDISTVNVNFSGIKIMTRDLKTNLKDLNDSIQYNFTKYTDELNRNATKAAVDFKDLLEQKIPSDSTIQGIYKDTIDAIQAALDKEGKDLQNSVEILKTKIKDLSDTVEPASKPSMSDEIGTVQVAMEGLDSNLERAGNASFDSALDSYTNRIFGVVDSYIDRLLHALDYDIGKCYPLWDTFNSIFVDSICGTAIASLNGFWFAIGWSLFFLMPSIIFAVKLASHFRTMTLYDDDASSDLNMEMVPQQTKGHHPLISPNKVGPMQSAYQDKQW